MIGVLCVGASLALAGCGEAPQLGTSDETFAAADALWTAVTAKRPELVDGAARKIDQLKAGGKLDEAGFQALSSVIAQARAGDWDDAREDLKSLVEGQRRHR